MALTAESRRQIAHQLLRAVILGSFAFLIVQLDRSGNLTLYIAPRMTLYVKLSALALYAAAVYQLFAALQTWMGRGAAASCDCDHTPSPSRLKNIIIYGLFLFPLLLGFLLPDTLMGSMLAAKKGMSLSGSESVNRQAVVTETPLASTPQSQPEAAPQADPATPVDPLDAMFPADIYTESYAKNGKKLYKQELVEVQEKQFIETLTTLDLYREHYVGKTVRISGFVYREGAMPSDQFVVSRFAMNCCSADSMPYGLMIRSDHAGTFEDDSWLQVTGILELTEYNGNEVMILQATASEPIPPSDTPYVYPDYDFGLDLE